MLSKKCGLLCVALLSVGLLLITGCGGSASPISIAINASSLNVDGTDTITLTATVTNDKNSGGVTFTVSGGGSLSNTTTTSATYTAPTATSSTQTVTITVTSVADPTKTGSVAITVLAKPSITTNGTNLAATVGAAYSVQLAGSGGVAPYTWTVASGTLPPCLSMSTGGLITGTVTAACAGTYNPIFTMTDSGSPTKLTVTTTVSVTIAAASAISFLGTMPAAATINTTFIGSAQASGGVGALTYSLLSGALPTGTILNASTGAVSGTATAAGVFTFKIGVADAYGDSASNIYTVTVSYPVMNITTGSLLPAGYINNGNYSQTLAATGGTNNSSNYSWSLTGGTTLPAGLSLSTAGVISGKPTGPAVTTPFSVQVTDTVANLSATGSFSIAINAGITITSTSPLTTGYLGSNYSAALAAIGGTGTRYTWTLTSGSTPPAGLGLSSAGVLSGKPTATGTSSFSITVTDSASNTASQTFSLTVNAGVSITSSNTLPKGYQGTIYPGATFTAMGGTGTGYTWNWSAAGGSSLPTGLVLSPSGTVSGIPTVAGAFSIIVTVTDSQSNTASATVSLTVESALSISPSTLPSGTVNVAYLQSLSATGGSGTGYTWASLANSNPALNISLSAAGVISGTPTTIGSTTITAQVTDSESHTTSASLTVTVYNVLTVTTTNLPATNVGAPYAQALAAGGGSGAGYTWSATSSNLTTYGLSLSSAGVITGTPTQSGTASLTAKVTDSSNNSATQALSITIYSALSLPAPDPSSLPSTGYTNVAYTGTINGSGGSGNYSWQATGLSDNLSPSPVSGTLTISGTPGATPATVTFNVTLTDTTTNASVTQNGYSIVISTPIAVSLPTPSSTIPGSATVNQSYNGAITVSGGVAPYTWSINGTTVTGAGFALGDNLTATSSGGTSLTVSGTPNAITTVDLTNVKVVDSIGSNQTNSYSIAVNAAGSNVSGQVFLNNNCGGGGTVPTITVNLLTNPGGAIVQTQTTNSSGNYTFTAIPNGNYTISPSISGPSSVFFPASYSVNVNNLAVPGENFQVSLGYTVSGTVSYGGSNSGHIYLALNSSTCGGNSSTGTSITAPGAFTIRGVPPGSYTLQAWMDPSTLSNGATNTSDPTGSTSGLTISNANLAGQTVTLTDNTPTSVPTSNPSLESITPTDQGVTISYKPVTTTVNGNKVEAATSYDVQWSTSSSFSTSPVTHNFKAIGAGGANIWILNNGVSGVTGSPFTNGTAYYFEVRARNAAGPASGWTVYGGGTPISVSPGASTTGIQVQGTVTIPTGITPTGPLYVGFYNQNTNTAYGARIAAPTAGANAYTAYVPSDSNPDYINFAILDQNNDGLIDAGDVSNTNGNNSNGISITAPLTGQNPPLPSVNITAAASTQYYQSTSSGGSSNGYTLNFDLREANKLPVAVTLTSGPNMINPIDIGACSSCGSTQFQFYSGIGGAVPTVGDTYNFTVTYGDGSQDTGSTVNGKVTAFGSTGAIVGASDLVTNLSPSANSSTSVTPTFTWTYPAGASTATYNYSFYISDNSGNTIWQIPGNNSNYNSFTYAQDTSGTLIWGTDPIPGDNSSPTGSLSTTTQYSWQIQVQDSLGNEAQTQTWYQP